MEGAQGAVKEWLGRRGPFVQSSVKKGTVDSIRGVRLAGLRELFP